jgi:hypothetical protein
MDRKQTNRRHCPTAAGDANPTFNLRLTGSNDGLKANLVSRSTLRNFRAEALKQWQTATLAA